MENTTLSVFNGKATVTIISDSFYRWCLLVCGGVFIIPWPCCFCRALAMFEEGLFKECWKIRFKKWGGAESQFTNGRSARTINRIRKWCQYASMLWMKDWWLNLPRPTRDLCAGYWTPSDLYRSAFHFAASWAALVKQLSCQSWSSRRQESSLRQVDETI